jgi:preprotein translocase subunit SecG
MHTLFSWLVLLSAVLMVIFILLQSRGSSLGGTFGGDSNFYRSKRGVEKVLFNGTIVLAAVFVGSTILSILAPK